MKKNLMTYAAGRMVIALFFCCTMTTVVNAQTAEPESKMDKYLRLSKEADENPTNWQTQLEKERYGVIPFASYGLRANEKSIGSSSSWMGN